MTQCKVRISWCSRGCEQQPNSRGGVMQAMSISHVLVMQAMCIPHVVTLNRLCTPPPILTCHVAIMPPHGQKGRNMIKHAACWHQTLRETTTHLHKPCSDHVHSNSSCNIQLGALQCLHLLAHLQHLLRDCSDCFGTVVSRNSQSIHILHCLKSEARFTSGVAT
jgi:hypothetical protein